MTDLEIAQKAQMLPIREVAKKLNISEDDLDPYGKYKAKLPLHLINAEKMKHSKLVLVTAITPTPAGEGKTTVSIGLTEGLNRIGKKADFCIARTIVRTCFWNQRRGSWWWLFASGAYGGYQLALYG